MPGLSKEDLKITIDDGVLTIKGEVKEVEEGGGSEDDEQWSMRSYRYYNTSVLLLDDAKVDDIKAELKNGVLYINIPRTEQFKKDIKEVKSINDGFGIECLFVLLIKKIVILHETCQVILAPARRSHA